MTFSPEALRPQLEFPAGTRRVVVAFSGGLDSTALLHALVEICSQLPGHLHALHVDHSLQAASASWAEHCHRTALELDVDFSLLKILVDPAAGASLEAAAREARYRAFGEFLQAGDCLLTAQHADDQAETFLLQALRGAGPQGLSAMPALKSLGAGWQLRPLLPWTRRELEDWARAKGLDWVDDPSNADSRFDRNYLRNTVMPALRERWPGLATTLSRSARHCAEAAELVGEEGERLLASAAATPDRIPLQAFEGLSTAARRLLLRQWLAGSGILPSEASLHQAEALLHVRQDAEAELRINDHLLRRHRDTLFLARSEPGRPRGGNWDTRQEFELGEGHGRLRRVAAERGIDPAIETVDLRYRQGGERLRPDGDPHTRELKKLLQEQDIPRWERDRLPLLYDGDRLLAVADLWIAADAAVPGGWRVDWLDRSKSGPNHS